MNVVSQGAISSLLPPPIPAVTRRLNDVLLLVDWANNTLKLDGSGGSSTLHLGFGVAVALIAFIGIFGGYKLISRYRRSAGEELRQLLAEQEQVTVLMHPNPDPDAMASAMGVEQIASSVGTTVTIQYTGQIRHQENRAFKNVLGVDCTPIETASELATRESVVLVDHNTPRGFTDSEALEPIAVIDHHPGNGGGESFTDVREEYGATSTILTEYLVQIGAESVSVDSDLATGLVYGVYSDTDTLTRGCIKPDFDACSELLPATDSDLLRRISNPQVSHDVLKVKAKAIMNVQIDGSFAVCNVGEIDNVDSLSQAVDELMRIEGVTAAVVYANRNETIHVSGRSHDDRVHIGESLQYLVSDIELATGGGHARMGGGQIPTTTLNEIGDSGETPYDEFNERLFEALNGNC